MFGTVDDGMRAVIDEIIALLYAGVVTNGIIISQKPCIHTRPHIHKSTTHHMVVDMTRSPAVAEGPRNAGVPVEILAAVERLYYTSVAAM